MMKTFFETIIVGFLETNCYLVSSEKEGCLYIIDPGEDARTIVEKVKSCGIREYKILLTHGHVDHIRAVPEVMETLNITTLFLHKHDVPLYKSPENSVMPWIPAIRNQPIPSHEILSGEFRIIHTPGHTRGCVCFYFPSMNKLFSGDTLFRESVGRTDLPGGNFEDLEKSIREKLFTLPEDTEVFPGHGPSTTIGYEKRNNQFI